MHRHSRRGYTLLEVAFVVVIALMISTGAMYGYVVNRDEASSAMAHRRILAAKSTLEAVASGNGGTYPVSGSGQLGSTWARAHPDEWGTSPWGGPTADQVDGMTEEAPITDGSVDPASAPDITARLAADGTRQSNLHYTSIEGNRFVRVTTRHDGQSHVYQGYVLAIYDGRGNPYFDAIGGTK